MKKAILFLTLLTLFAPLTAHPVSADSSAADTLIAADWTQQCVEKARVYLQMGGFSKHDLYQQLQYEGFDDSQITAAVNQLRPDWNEQCLLKAKQYMDLGGFSQESLKQQLRFHKFTESQINYAVNRL